MVTGYSAGRMVAHNMVTTQFELDGFKVSRTLGVVRGIVVRSRSIFGTIGAGLQTLVGGNITLLTNLCEKTRQEAFDLMLQHAAELGANAVVGARYDATELMQGVTEVLAYGTAVFVDPENDADCSSCVVACDLARTFRTAVSDYIANQPSTFECIASHVASNLSTTGVLLGTRNRLRNNGAHLRLRADYIAGDNQFDSPV